VGAVLLTADGQLVYSANQLPEGVKNEAGRCDRPLKYQYIEHAERLCLYRAARSGVKTEGATLYCPWYACVECARAIICSGVKECVGLRSVMERTPERWLESVNLAEGMLKEAEVTCSYIDEKLGSQMWFDGAWIDV
jgi:dCMP deaminase